MQDWFAFTGNGSEFNFSRAGEVDFPNSGIPKAENNYMVSARWVLRFLFQFFLNFTLI